MMISRGWLPQMRGRDGERLVRCFGGVEERLFFDVLSSSLGSGMFPDLPVLSLATACFSGEDMEPGDLSRL
jgi:hypothetical protein